MRPGSLSALVLGTPLLSATDATIYGLTKSTTGAGFFQDFNFQAILDPTHGRVQYVNASTAVQDDLAWVSQDGLQLCRCGGCSSLPTRFLSQYSFWTYNTCQKVGSSALN